MKILEKSLIIIASHGVGDWHYEGSDKSWFYSMEKNIRNFVRKLSKKKIPEDFMRIYSVGWGSKIQDGQDKFLKDVERHINPRGLLISRLFHRANNAVRAGMIHSAGDLIAAFDEMQWDIIKGCVDDTLELAMDEATTRREKAGLPEDSETLVMWIGHSLGSYIFFKYLHGSENEYGGLRFNSAVFYGSPCSLLHVLSKDRITPRFPSDNKPELKPFIYNFWVQRDPMSAPIRPFLLDNYPQANVDLIDKKLFLPGLTGSLPVIAHTKYHRSRAMGMLVARKIVNIWKALGE